MSENEVIKNLSICDILEYYDGWIIALAESFGAKYLLLTIDPESYFVIQTNEEEISEYKEGKISLLHIIQRRESVIIAEGECGKIMKVEDIPAEWLPDEDAFYENFAEERIGSENAV